MVPRPVLCFHLILALCFTVASPAFCASFQVAPVAYTNHFVFAGVTADLNGDGKLDIVASGAVNSLVVFLGNGDGSFQPAVEYHVLAEPINIAIGDFNNDGVPDLVAALDRSDELAVLLGLGDGTFGPPTQFAAGGAGGHMVLTDLNEDGALDIAVTYVPRVGVFTLGVLLGDGDGTFQSPLQITAGGEPSLLSIADLNGDGKLDAITANYAALDVSVLLGNGDGTFQAATHYALRNGVPLSMLVADLDGNGTQDLVVSLVGKGSIEVFPGDGLGNLLFPHSIDAGFSPLLIAVADVNHDGLPDLLANYDPYLKVLLNQGNGEFQLSHQYLDSIPGSGVAGDFNQDGNLDVTVVGTGLSFMAGAADGTFPDVPVAYSKGSPSNVAAVGDVNGDGKPDIVAGSYDEGGEFGVLFGSGDGTFTPGGFFPGSPYADSIVLADFNLDGKLDAALANQLGFTVSVVLGNGDGSFGPPSDWQVGGSPSVVAADLNLDGIPDLATANYSSNNASILLGIGDGTFQNAQNFSEGGDPEGIAIGDFNGDGIPDLAVANPDYYGTGKPGLMIRLGNGDGTFGPRTDYLAHSYFGGLTAADLNGDGKLDLIITATYHLEIFFGNGDGTFQSFVRRAAGETPEQLVVADFNRDGKPDLAYLAFDVSFGSIVGVLLGNGDGTFAGPLPYPAGYNPTGLVVGDFNGDGAPDLAVIDGAGTGTVNVLLNTGH